MSKVYIGGCLCGSIRFTASSPNNSHTCSCDICRKHTGAPTVVWIEFDAEKVAILQLECSVSQSGCELALARLTDLLLVYIVEQIVDEHLVDIKLLDISQHAPFSDLLLQIMHNPTLDWSIDMMAGKVNMSRSTFIRKIDDICGYTPNELVTRLRINIAINLLRRGYKVEEVTSRVGYESLSGFNKAFRKITSSTPADFWKAR